MCYSVSMVDAIFACTAPSSLIWYNTGVGPVAQWIERLRPKEKVVRSTRAWATIFGIIRLWLKTSKVSVMTRS